MMDTATKHTPGPWTAEIHEGLPATTNSRQEPAFAVIRAIDSVAGMRQGDERFDEFEANARLIAAAPQMLEALYGLMRLVHPYGVGTKGYTCAGCQGRALLAERMTHKDIANCPVAQAELAMGAATGEDFGAPLLTPNPMTAAAATGKAARP